MNFGLEVCARGDVILSIDDFEVSEPGAGFVAWRFDMEVCCGSLMILCCVWSLKFLVLAGLMIGRFSFFVLERGANVNHVSLPMMG